MPITLSNGYLWKTRKTVYNNVFTIVGRLFHNYYYILYIIGHMQSGTKAYTDAQQKQEKKSGTNTRVREFLALLLVWWASMTNQWSRISTSVQEHRGICVAPGQVPRHCLTSSAYPGHDMQHRERGLNMDFKGIDDIRDVSLTLTAIGQFGGLLDIMEQFVRDTQLEEQESHD